MPDRHHQPIDRSTGDAGARRARRHRAYAAPRHAKQVERLVDGADVTALRSPADRQSVAMLLADQLPEVTENVLLVNLAQDLPELIHPTRERQLGRLGS